MSGTEPVAAPGHERADALTADRWGQSEALRWPGTDGMTVDEVMLAAGGEATPAAAEVSRGAEPPTAPAAPAAAGD